MTRRQMESPAAEASGPRGIVFPSPLIPVDVYAAWLLGDWTFVIDPKKVAECYFGVDGRYVFMAKEDDHGVPETIGRLPDDWEAFTYGQAHFQVTLIGPALAVEAARILHEQVSDGTKEFSHRVFDTMARLDRQIASCGPMAPQRRKPPRKAVP